MHTKWLFRKDSRYRPLLLVNIAIIFLLLLFHFTQGANNKLLSQSSLPQSQAKSGLPERLVIPAINVDAAIQHLGVDSLGDMAVPSNVVDVGWFKLGSRPGEKGSAVISGHFDGTNNEEGVFNNLHKLKKGDKVQIKDDKGTVTTFIVQESRLYNPGYAEEVFNTNDDVHLNLITCDGVWDKAKKTYSKRLVVFASIEN